MSFTKNLTLVCVAWALLTSVAQAELILDIRSATISVRSRSFVDVFAYTSDGGPIDIAGFGLTFEVVDVSPAESLASGEVFFLDSFVPGDATRQSNSEQGDPNYILHGHALPENFQATRQDPEITKLFVGDSTNDPLAGTQTNISVIATVAAPLLLARLEIGQRQDLSVALERGSYELRLVSGEYFNADFSIIENFAPPSSGLITISAVPEPSSLLTLGLAIGLSIFRRRNRIR